MIALLVVVCVVLLFVIALVIVSLARSYKEKGIERVKDTQIDINVLANAIGESIPNEQYVYYDLYFKHQGTMTHIPALVINKYGVFVIETRDWQGQALGRDSTDSWVVIDQKIIDKANPVKFNLMHKKKIKKILNVPKKEVHNIVIFSETCDISQVLSNHSFSISNIKTSLIDPAINLTPKKIEKLKEKFDKFLSKNTVSKDEYVSFYQALIEKSEKNKEKQ